MTGLDLEPIKARVAAATKGPWSATHDGNREPPRVWSDAFDDGGELVAKVCPTTPYSECIPDAEFIAHAREDVPALLAEVRRLQTVVERVREMHQPVKWFTEECSHDGDCDCVEIDAGLFSPLVFELMCEACSGDIECSNAYQHTVSYPCPTLHALDGGGSND